MTLQSHQHNDKKHARRPQLNREVAAQLASTEFARVADLLDRLTPDQWTTQTECPGWDVRAMAGHMLGMIQLLASLPELAGQQFTARRRIARNGGLLVDALTGLQVENNAALSTSELVDTVRTLSPKAARNRRRAPGIVRNHPLDDEEFGWWTYGYLFDVILTRDPFMHRIDISRAIGVPMTATAEHEGVIVNDVVAEWAQRHDRPFTLELTGPAGGRWIEGDGESLVLDPFEFCRILAGRAPGAGLLATRVPF
ncbi:hypothetical protein GCM10010528_16880 [Gordonia defluvii]|jgi:uncharacterized protein (TIGR03083 family)|uniref:Mycothiol-dependent maleylpyruvate isomerase metal-binding domain-containing protein n=1 Tax=Gordonia defluvii TaxID=283718 RepID=A0ABP6LAQ2_9ACTN|nr:maleylpyruvate isomerase family mycothiol-dependent enzyme [Gordonia sp. UBA5067]